MDVQKLIRAIFLMTQNTCCHSKGGFTPKLAEAYTNHLKDETSLQQGRCCLWGGVQQGRYSLMIWFRMGKQCLGWLGNCERTQVLAFCGLASLSKQIREIAFTELHSQWMAENRSHENHWLSLKVIGRLHTGQGIGSDLYFLWSLLGVGQHGVVGSAQGEQLDSHQELPWYSMIFQ